MKYVLSPKITLLANRAAKIPGIKKLLRPFYYSYKEYLDKKRNAIFLSKGLRVLEEFDKIMLSHNFNYSVFAGTLLGAIREKSFLKHDLDIDTVMFYKDYTPELATILQEAGFNISHRFTIDDGKRGLEETYVKEDISIDIFFIHSDDSFPTYQCDFRAEKDCISWEESMKKHGYVIARRNEFPVNYETRRLEFNGIYINAIRNAEEWLSKRYGEDYMIPNPDFDNNAENPNMKIWDGVKAIYKTF